MEKYQLKRIKYVEFIQLGEIGIKGEGAFSLTGKLACKNGGVLVGFLLFLAGIQAPTLIGRGEGVCSFLSI